MSRLSTKVYPLYSSNEGDGLVLVTLGTDEKALISVVGKRSPEQMIQISKSYKAAYGKDLHDGMHD
jgi:Annexin